MKNLGKWSIASVGMLGLLALSAGPAGPAFAATGGYAGGNASAYATPENLGGGAGGNAGMASGTPLFCIAPAPLAGNWPVFELAHQTIPAQTSGITIAYTAAGKNVTQHFIPADLAIVKNYGAANPAQFIAFNAAGIAAFKVHYPDFPGITTLTLENPGTDGCGEGLDQYEYSSDPAQAFARGGLGGGSPAQLSGADSWTGNWSRGGGSPAQLSQQDAWNTAGLLGGASS